jgi:hypothetical protein
MTARYTQPDLFGDNPGEAAEATTDDVLETEGEVFALAREICGRPAGEEPEYISPITERRLRKAADKGLVAQWADYEKAKGHVSIHDPGSGHWCDVPWKDAPGWARRESLKRSELYRDFYHDAHDLTAREMEKIWEAEHPAADVGIVEAHPLEEGAA